MFRTISLFLLSLFTFQTVQAQVTASYNGKSFGACEVVRASIGNSGETMIFSLSEIDTDGGGLEADNIDLPPFYQLLIEVKLPDGLPFPITAERENQVTISLSGLQESAEENALFESQMSATDFSGREAAADAAQGEKQSIEEQSRAIAMKMASGEMSPEEGSKAMEAIVAKAEALINSVPEAPDFEELAERAIYGIVFYDTRELTQAQPIRGQLTITKFTETEFVANFSGQQMVECLTRRAATSPEKEAECGQAQSSILPKYSVLREEPINFTVNVKLKVFADYRK